MPSSSPLATRLIAAALFLLGCCGAFSGSSAQGGNTTVKATHRGAYSLPAPNMPIEQRLNFQVGNSFFRNPWVIAPASTTARDGLGPLYNTNACQNCHVRDGRGHAPDERDDNAVSMLVKICVNNDESSICLPDPVYGDQIQDFSNPGVSAEAKVSIDYETSTVTAGDGEIITLRRPQLKLHRWGYGEPENTLQTSVRVAPAMIGLGLLEAIDAETLEQLSDPEDSDQNGISGRLNRVWDVENNQDSVGRFGWKAAQPSVKQQVSVAFHSDMGLTTSMIPTMPCSEKQVECRLAAHGGNPEVSDTILDHVTLYSANLAVPAQRHSDTPVVQRGATLFRQVGCHQCHIEQITTGTSPYPWLSQQTIAPYTDLLLHDMGPGLADNKPEFSASGSEWRTAPLWGIGLSKTVAERANFLHDGRAETLVEAIVWHGGEAQTSRDQFLALTSQDRHSLIQFLQSL